MERDVLPTWFHTIVLLPRKALTWLDVFSYDGHMVISIRPCVLMPEAYHVTQFMNNNSKFITVLANGDCLRSIPSSTHIGTAPTTQQKVGTRSQRGETVNHCDEPSSLAHLEALSLVTGPDFWHPCKSMFS